MKSLTLLACLACMVSTACASESLTAGQVAAEIKAQGAKATIAKLAADDQWDTLSEHIVDGEPDWIALAPQLAPGSDAGSAEDLGIALAFALPKRPVEVLHAIDPGNGIVLGVDRVCGMPFIEDTVQDLQGYKRKAIAAVRAVTDSDLQNVRQACIAALGKVD